MLMYMACQEVWTGNTMKSTKKNNKNIYGYSSRSRGYLV